MKNLNAPICPLHISNQVCVHTLAAHGLYVHALPGRLRVEIPSLKDNPNLARQTEQCLSQLEGVRRVQCSSQTSRALIEFDPRVRGVDDLVGQIFEPRALSSQPARLPSARSFACNTIFDVVGDMMIKAALALV